MKEYRQMRIRERTNQIITRLSKIDNLSKIDFIERLAENALELKIEELKKDRLNKQQ